MRPSITWGGPRVGLILGGLSGGVIPFTDMINNGTIIITGYTGSDER